MKKQIILIVFLIIVSGLRVHSQILKNTIWDVKNASGNYFGYFKFGIDTLFEGINQNSYIPWGTYKERGDSISFIDFGQHGCSVTDTGKYTFSIKNDTLKYTLIKDSCEQRRENLTTFYWVRIPSGIIEANSSATILLFPNPSRGKFSVISETTQIIGKIFEILDMLGRKVFYLEINSFKTEIDLSGIPKGIYCYQLKSKNEIIRTGKIIID